jgi:sulfonate transport system permease protein
MATDIDVGLLAEPVAAAAVPARERARVAPQTSAPALETFTARPPRGRAAALARRTGRPLAAYGSPLAVLLAWQVASWLGALPDTTAASPIDVGRAAVHLWQVGAPSTLGEDLRVSLTRALAGLALGVSAGAVAAVVAGLSRVGEHVLNGPVQILNTIPFLALLPLMIMWFGIGEASKVLLIALGAGVPVYLNLFGGIRDVDARLVEMARAAGAGRRRLITRVLLPGALPAALVGLRFALAYSVLGLVVAEQINANSGIGFMITQAQTYQRVDEMFLGLAIYAVLGLAGDQIVRILERALLTWHPSHASRA